VTDGDILLAQGKRKNEAKAEYAKSYKGLTNVPNTAAW
jgi:predicted negative regulator of RcsB-dependent stress response